MSVKLRVATPGDLEAIMQLERSTFESDAWSEQAMRAEIGNPNGFYLVAELLEGHEWLEGAELLEGQAIVGYAGLLAPRRSEQADIQTIAVAPAARRAGLGRTLMNALLAEATGRGAREVFLEVRADNPGAQRLYDSLGFEPIAVRAGYYQPDNVDAIVMRLSVPNPTVVPA